MDIKSVLEKRFGERCIHRIFNDPLMLRIDDPLPVDRRPFFAYVGIVAGKNWLPDKLSFIEVRDGEVLDGLLTDVSKFYKNLFGRNLKIVVGGNYLDTDAVILLGTRAKSIKEYLRNCRATMN